MSDKFEPAKILLLFEPAAVPPPGSSTSEPRFLPESGERADSAGWIQLRRTPQKPNDRQCSNVKLELKCYLHISCCTAYYYVMSHGQSSVIAKAHETHVRR